MEFEMFFKILFFQVAVSESHEESLYIKSYNDNNPGSNEQTSFFSK